MLNLNLLALHARTVSPAHFETLQNALILVMSYYIDVKGKGRPKPTPVISAAKKPEGSLSSLYCYQYLIVVSLSY